MEEYPYYVGGEFRKSNNRLVCEAAAKKEILGYMFEAEARDLVFALEKSRQALAIWRNTPFSERAQTLRQIGETILDNLSLLAEIESKDVGKIMKESLFVDIPLAADCFKYYASFLESLPVVSPASQKGWDIFTYEPYGVAGIILPYNVPLMIFGFSVAAALAAGNAVIVKPSEFASLSLLKLAQFLDKLDLPPGLINIVSGRGEKIGKALAQSEVDILSFTGSRKTFMQVYRESASHPKKIICELGGCNVGFIFKSAHLERAVDNILAAAFMKQGQICIGVSLLLIEEEVFSQVKTMLKEKVEKIHLGDPQDPSANLSALISSSYLEEVDKRIRKLVREAQAEVISGGRRVEGTNFYLPTLLELKELVWEEFFAPVLMIKSFEAEEAEEILEKNPSGLTLQIWTADLAQAENLAHKAQVGTVWINTFAQMSPATPFGGMKQSGWARVLGPAGFFEFCHIKHIGIGNGPSPVEGWFGF